MKSTAKQFLKWGVFGTMIFSVLALHGQCTAVIGTSIDPVAGCEMLTVQFYDNSSAVASRSWDFGDGSLPSNAQNPTHSFSAGKGDTTYTVTLTVECTSGDISQATKEVTVYASPRIEFEQSKTSLCAISDSVCFSNLSSELEGNNYLWNFGDGTISEAYEPCKVYSTPGTYNLELTVTNGHGCVNSSIIEDYIEVVPVPNTAFLPSEITGCAPFTALFTNNTDTLGNSYSGWIWDYGDGSPIESGFYSPPHTYMDPGKYQINLGATNALGCSNFSTQTITVHPSPVASFQWSDPNCLNQGAVFEFNGEASDSATFLWQFDNPLTGGESTGPGPHVKRWSEAGIKEIQMEVIDNNCSATAIEEVVVNPVSRVELSLSTDIDTICEGEEITFKALPDQYSRYQFYLNSTLVQDSPDNEFTAAGLQSGDRIHVRITDQLGCSEVFSDTVNLTVIPLPAVTLYSSAGGNLICEGETVNFTATPSSFDEYVFYLGNTVVQRGSSPVWSSAQLEDGDRVRVEVPGLHCGQVKSNEIITSVLDVLPAPDVNCASTGLDYVRFSWNTVEGATAYMVRVNGSGFIFPVGGATETWHQVDGLTEGDTVSIEVRALRVGDCTDGLISAPRICIAQECVGIDFDLPVRDTVVCEGEEILLTAQNMAASSWSLSWDGNTAGGDSTYSVQPLESRQVPVVMVDSSQLHCQPVVKNISLEVIPTPAIQMSAPAGILICEGMELEVEAIPGTYDRYMFFRNSQILQDGPSSVMVDENPGNGQVYFVVAESGHCIRVSDTLRVEVERPLTPPTISVLDSDLSSVTFRWNPVAGATGYLIRINDGEFQTPSSGLQGVTHRVGGLLPGEGLTAMVMALGEGSCGDSDPSPPAVGFAEECRAITYAMDGTVELCEGTEATIAISELNLDNYSVTWGNSVPGKELSQSWYPERDTVVRISIRNMDELVCPARVEYARIRVIPRPPKPTLISSVGSGPICEGTPFSLLAGPAGLPAYDFYDGFRLLQSGFSNEIQIDQWTNGHSPRVIARDGACESEATALTPISVYSPLPVPQVNCQVSTDTSITWTWDPVPGATTYLVSVDGGIPEGPSSGPGSLEHVLPDLMPGEYHSISVQAVGSGPCGNSEWSNPRVCQSIPCDLIAFEMQPYDTICEGESLNLVLNNISAANYSIAWNGVDAGQQASLLFDGSADSIVSVELTDLDQAMCPSVKKEFHIQVHPIPLGVLTALSDTICEGEEAGFVVQPAGYDAYRFYSESGLLMQDSAWHYLYTDTLSSDFSLYVETESLGCSHVSEAVGIGVTQLPELQLQATLTGEICLGQLVQFSATPGFDRYLFRDAHRLLMDSRDPQVYLAVRSEQVTVQAIRGEDCIVASTDTLQYTLKELPEAALVASTDLICPGESVTFTVTATPDGNSDFASFDFYSGTELLASGDKQSYTGNFTSGMDDVHAFVYSSQGCRSLPTNSVAFAVKDFPVNRIASDVEGICLGDSASLWIELDSTMATQNFYWDSGLRDSTLRVSPDADRIYYLYSTANGCTLLSDTLQLGVDREQAPVAYAGEDMTICISDSIQLFGSGGTTRSWWPVSLLSDPESPEPWVRSDTITSLVLTVSNRYCTSSDTLVLYVDRCLQDLVGEIPQIITPNGDNSNDVWIIPDIDYFTANRVEIYNRWGSEVFFAAPYKNTWNGTNASGEPLPEGTYYYLIDLGQGAPPRTGYIIIHR